MTNTFLHSTQKIASLDCPFKRAKTMDSGQQNQAVFIYLLIIRAEFNVDKFKTALADFRRKSFIEANVD